MKGRLAGVAGGEGGEAAGACNDCAGSFLTAMGAIRSRDDMSFHVIQNTRIIACGAFLVGVVAWLSGGARAGFYRSYRVETKVDEITGLEYPERTDAFLPGIESLGFGFIAFAILLGLSILVESRAGRRS